MEPLLIYTVHLLHIVIIELYRMVFKKLLRFFPKGSFSKAPI